MINKLIFFLLLILLTVSCTTTKLVSFKIVDNKGKKFAYQVRIPKGFKVEETYYENGRDKIFRYTDSSAFFFTDNILGGLSPDAYSKYGKDINLKFMSADTITVNGTNNTGTFWKERKAINVVSGYLQVPIKKKKSLIKY